MADKRLTQSPRALRDSTNDPEKHSKGEYRVGMEQPSRSDGINDGAWKHQGDEYTPMYEARGHKPRAR